LDETLLLKQLENMQMKRILKATAEALDRAQARFLRSRLKISRRGSVLIIVVALLVLMAIIGTAYISTARTDRGAAATNSQNTEIQLLLQGVEDMASSQIIADVNPYVTTETINGVPVTINATRFRTANTTYKTYNSAGAVNLTDADQWLSDRVPVLLDPTVAEGSTNPPIWHFLSLPPTNIFESPTGGTYGGTATTLTTTTPAGADRVDYEPTYVTAGGTNYPALNYYYYNTTTGTWGWSPSAYLAADTDGDGIADAGLFRLPCGEINGVTYYGAYRIVDNAAAVNASVAWTPQAVTLSPQQTLPGNFWPTNVDLGTDSTGLVADSLTNLNTFRFGSTGPSLTPSEGSFGFSYETTYDAAWHELDRRLQNPATGYAAMSISDSAAMAHRFVIRDSNASQSAFEQYLPISTLNNAPTQAYLASDIANWYGNNFNYTIGQQATTMSLRSLLVGRNPVSNFVMSKFGPASVALPGAAYNAATAYTFGDWVSYNGHAYVCIQPNSGQTPPTTATTAGNGIPGYYADSAFWVYEPWYNAPIKTSVNTASFAQLWLAYWSVMCDTQNAAPAPQVNSATTVGANMFRSSLRYTNGAIPGVANGPLSATQELQLRAAIAAANTIDLRNTFNSASGNPGGVFPTTVGWLANPNIQSTVLQLENYAGGSPAPQYGAVVYGNKPQPYITEVYADNDPTLVSGTLGYIAIELYNPYPYPITLNSWALVTIPRANGSAGTPLVATPIASTMTGGSNWASAPPTIPAKGFCVLANGATPAGYTTGPTATVGSATDPLYIVPGLEAAFGNDLVLMRPMALAAGPGSNTFTVPNGVPVDSYDFTGLNTQTTFAAGNCYEWLYLRDSTLPWHCVYPGPFNPTAGQDGQHPRFLGTAVPLAINTAGTPRTLDISSLGKAGSITASYTGTAYSSMPIQLNNVDFGGPVKLQANGNYFPFGQFPRNADIMQVPFIGAYKIYDPTGANLLEMNPITLDAAYAAWTSSDQTAGVASVYANQNIGRFAPWYQNDYATNAPSNWTTRLFDYLTVQDPADDYLPNASPVDYYLGTGAKFTPMPIANSKSTIANAVTTNPGSATEDTVPVDGLININTAPWRVLATLPWSDAQYSPTNDGGKLNAAIAQAIVNYRDGYYSTVSGSYVSGNGPFKTIFDLNRVVAAANSSMTGVVAPVQLVNTCGSYALNGYMPTAPTPAPSNNDGDLTPLYATSNANGWATSSGVNNDFQTWNLAISRVSNLITTRSDSYTVYVLVQGWSNAGTAGAKLVVQRRAAFIVDRSGMTPANPTLNVTNVSTN
jgi:hypothetical protein